MMKTNKSRFTEDDIRRELPPDVFSLLHDLAYLNPHRTSLRQSVISFINGARAALRAPSTEDLNEMLLKRERFVIERCCDRVCLHCGEGVKLTSYERAGGVFFQHYVADQLVNCPATSIRRMAHKWEAQRELAAKMEKSKTVLAPEKLAFDRQIPLSVEERRKIGCDCTPVRGDNEHGDCAYRRAYQLDLEGRN